MSDQSQFEHDFEATDEAAAVATSEVIVEATFAPAVEEPEAPADDDFFAENAAPEVPAVDPSRIITIIPSSSDNKYVETDGNPVAMLDLIHRAGLQFAGDFQCYLNNAEISLTTLVPAGSTVSIVGKVKGG